MADIASFNSTAIADIDKIFGVVKSGLSSIYGLTIPTGSGAPAPTPGAFYPTTISNSCRFDDGDTAYLSKTYGSAGDRRQWTWSGWYKRGNLGVQQILFSGGSTGAPDAIQINSGDALNYYGGGAVDANKVSTMLLRDTASWYHIVVALDTDQGTAANRNRIYVNGVEVTDFDTNTNHDLNDDLNITNNVLHCVGNHTNLTLPMDGYLSDVYFIDGQQLTPSFFGTTNSGVWVPTTYTGTYGTNGFRLDFADSGSLGNDVSGNNNDYTSNNLAASDQVPDTPTNNWCVLNAVWKPDTDAGVLKQGNLLLESSGAAAYSCKPGTFAFDSGKWYFEMKYVNAAGAPRARIGVVDITDSTIGYLGSDAGAYAYVYDGDKSNNTTDTAYGSSFTTGDIVACAIDMDNGAIWFSKNGTWQNSATINEIATGDTSNAAFTGITGYKFPACNVYQDDDVYMNFGQDSANVATGNADINNYGDFEYTVPSGFLALCSANLTDPAIIKSSEGFDTTIYTGNGSARSITGIDFQPDLVWIKNRAVADEHKLTDSVRGVTKELSSDSNNLESTAVSGVTAFNANGFSLGNGADGYNDNTETFVSWSWLEGATQGFDIVGYVGTGASGTVAHNLGVAPEVMIVKGRDTSAARNWGVYHASAATDPETDQGYLNTTVAFADDATFWNDTAPTSTVFTVGTWDGVNESGKNYIAYLFAPIDGFSKFGSYEGNGNANGPFVYCGFRPAMIICKSIDSTSSWHVYDNSRVGYNAAGNYRLNTDATSAESTASEIDILSNGFKIRIATDPNVAETYIFMAWAEMPAKFSNAR